MTSNNHDDVKPVIDFGKTSLSENLTSEDIASLEQSEITPSKISFAESQDSNASYLKTVRNESGELLTHSVSNVQQDELIKMRKKEIKSTLKTGSKLPHIPDIT